MTIPPESSPHNPLPTPTDKKPSKFSSLLAWANPKAVYQQARREGAGKNGVAAGFAIGIFIANTPLWGLHAIMCIITARILKLHPLPMLTGSLIGITPLGPILIGAAIWLGSIMIHGHGPGAKVAEMKIHRHDYIQLFKIFRDIALEWTLGSIIVGAVSAVVGFGIVRLMLAAIPNEPPGPPPADEDVDSQPAV